MSESITHEEAVKIGIREGIKYLKDQEFHKTKKRYDRRLRNTRLLLRNYRNLQMHYKLAESSVKYIEQEKAIDVLDDIEAIDDEEQYVQAISRTKERTKAMVKHIDRVLKYYDIICKAEGGLKKRRCDIIKALYVDPVKDDVIPTYQDVGVKLDISGKTVARDVWRAIEDISVLLFGIDGIKL